MLNPVPLSLPPKSDQENQKNQRKGNASFTQMWVKGALLHFIVDSSSQKNLISAEVVKRLDLPMTPHLQPYTIGWLHQGRDLRVVQQCHLPYTSSLSKMRYCVIFIPLKFVMFF
jgi:hypothetical protein